MPQLILKPWFWILMLTWLILLFILTPKIESHKFYNQPEMASTLKPESTAWNWVWH